MKKNEREKYKKKLSTYEKLGAIKFQKVVFGVERVKFKIIKKLFPNFIKYYDKYCDFIKKSALKKASSKEEADQIVKKITDSKMAMRKEFNQEKNRNYHINSKKPTEIYKYLEWNKEVHKKGIVTNAVLMLLAVIGITMSVPGAVPLLVIELISAGINFECINIQNYNICRYKIMEDKLKREEEYKTNKAIEEYEKAADVLHKSIEKKADLPSMQDIINNINTTEELEQLKKFIRQEIGKRENIDSNQLNIRGNK